MISEGRGGSTVRKRKNRKSLLETRRRKERHTCLSRRGERERAKKVSWNRKEVKGVRKSRRAEGAKRRRRTDEGDEGEGKKESREDAFNGVPLFFSFPHSSHDQIDSLCVCCSRGSHHRLFPPCPPPFKTGWCWSWGEKRQKRRKGNHPIFYFAFSSSSLHIYFLGEEGTVLSLSNPTPLHG